MHTPDKSQMGAALAREFPKRLMRVGIVFSIIGVIAIILPSWATLAGELLAAWMLALWGAAGLWFAWEMRPSTEWRYAAAVFGVTLLLGLAFLLFPGAGIASLTIVMMVVFLLEGIVSILLGLRMSGHGSNWGWMIFSGTCSLLVGVIIVAGWPQTAIWTLGLLLGLNFLSTGLALIMLASAARKALMQ